jgi:hypothetical protein
MRLGIAKQASALWQLRQQLRVAFCCNLGAC